MDHGCGLVEKLHHDVDHLGTQSVCHRKHHSAKREGQAMLNKMRRIPVNCIRCSIAPTSSSVAIRAAAQCTRSAPLQSRWHSHSSSPPHSSSASPSTTANESSTHESESPEKNTQASAKKRQTLTERDEDHLRRMREAMGGADMANTEFEDGVPDRGMRRNVRENMFRIL